MMLIAKKPNAKTQRRSRREILPNANLEKTEPTSGGRGRLAGDSGAESRQEVGGQLLPKELLVASVEDGFLFDAEEVGTNDDETSVCIERKAHNTIAVLAGIRPVYRIADLFGFSSTARR